MPSSYLGCTAQIYRTQLDSDWLRGGLDYSPLTYTRSGTGIPKHTYSSGVGYDFAKQLKPFGAQAVLELQETGGVAVGTRKARRAVAKARPRR